MSEALIAHRATPGGASATGGTHREAVLPSGSEPHTRDQGQANSRFGKPRRQRGFFARPKERKWSSRRTIERLSFKTGLSSIIERNAESKGAFEQFGLEQASTT
jgi:hypothetical protein